MIEILSPGPSATVQDLGRPGWAASGVGRSGAADRVALRLGNRLVGNAPGAAAIEVTFGGLAFRTLTPVLVALTGAACPARTQPRAPIGPGVAVALPAGATVELGPPLHGLRTYVALRGGIDVPPVLGSRATDVLAGLGPSPLRAGDRLPLGTASDPVPAPAPGAVPSLDRPAVLTVIPGPRDDWASVDDLVGGPFTVGPASDRIGVRLGGRTVARRPGELPPEGMWRGCIQVPPDGAPVLLLADHPVTGGYPVVAVVRDADTDRAAQLRPGDTVRFRLARPAG